MVNKISKSKAVTGIAFIVAMPVDEVMEKLAKLSQLSLYSLSSSSTEHELEVSFADEMHNYTVYLSVKNWNDAETFVTLRPDNPPDKRLLLLGAGTVIIVTIILLSLQSYFVFVWLIFMLGGFYNYRHGFGRISLQTENTIDSRTRIKEKLLNTIVSSLTDKTDVQIVHSG
jgi:hypothetical protein